MFILASGPMFDGSSEVMLWPGTLNSPSEPGGAVPEAVEEALDRGRSQGAGCLHLASVGLPSADCALRTQWTKKSTFLAVVKFNPRKQIDQGRQQPVKG